MGDMLLRHYRKRAYSLDAHLDDLGQNLIENGFRYVRNIYNAVGSVIL